MNTLTNSIPVGRTYWHEIDSPIGRLLLAGDGAYLKLVHFQSGPRPQRPADGWIADATPFEMATAQLNEYFAGRRRDFDLRLAPEGTEFQRAVWQSLTRIPYGETISYAELARRVGNPRASRAVGLANGANPLPGHAQSFQEPSHLRGTAADSGQFEDSLARFGNRARSEIADPR